MACSSIARAACCLRARQTARYAHRPKRQDHRPDRSLRGQAYNRPTTSPSIRKVAFTSPTRATAPGRGWRFATTRAAPSRASIASTRTARLARPRPGSRAGQRCPGVARRSLSLRRRQQQRHPRRARKLWRFELNKDGRSIRQQDVIRLGQGRGPDGLKQDSEGRLYVAAGLNKPNPPFEPAKDIKGGIYVLSRRANC